MENGCAALKQKERVSFCDFWHIKDDFARKNAANTILNVKKHGPTNLYMLYPMV
jgi:hypothetical protein